MNRKRHKLFGLVVLLVAVMVTLAACDSGVDDGIVEIDEVAELEEVMIPFGTSEEDVREEYLAEDVEITFTDDGTETADIAWSENEDYEADQPGTNTFEGTASVSYGGESFTHEVEQDAVVQEEESELAFFEVTQLDLGQDNTVTQGDEVSVDYIVNNTGDETDTQNIEFTVTNGDPEYEDSNAGVGLASGEEEDAVFIWDTEDNQDTGDYAVEVSTDDDSDIAYVTVEEEPVQIFFEVEIDLITEIVAGDENAEFDLEYTVENTADVRVEQDVVFEEVERNGAFTSIGESNTLDLAAGAVVSDVFENIELDASNIDSKTEVTAYISTEDFEDTEAIPVIYGDPASLDDLGDPEIYQGDTLEVDFEGLENEHGVGITGEFDLEIEVDGVTLEAENVNFEDGDTDNTAVFDDGADTDTITADTYNDVDVVVDGVTVDDVFADFTVNQTASSVDGTIVADPDEIGQGEGFDIELINIADKEGDLLNGEFDVDVEDIGDVNLSENDVTFDDGDATIEVDGTETEEISAGTKVRTVSVDEATDNMTITINSVIDEDNSGIWENRGSWDSDANEMTFWISVRDKANDFIDSDVDVTEVDNLDPLWGSDNDPSEYYTDVGLFGPRWIVTASFPFAPTPPLRWTLD